MCKAMELGTAETADAFESRLQSTSATCDGLDIAGLLKSLEKLDGKKVIEVVACEKAHEQIL